MEANDHPLQRFLDLFPPGEARELLAGPVGWVILGVTALVLLLIVFLILNKFRRMLFGRKRKVTPDPERKLIEDLTDYPLPGPPGPRMLTVEGVPVQVRLVVVAPTGKQHEIDPDAIVAMLDQVMRGMAEVLQHDRPRLRVWPAQLSSQGFMNKFHRLTHRPEPDGEPSPWILVAGQTPARPRPLLVGLALWSKEANLLGRLTLDAVRWNDLLRVVKTADL